MNRYRIHARGFVAVEVAAGSLRAALEKVHPNVRAAFDYATVCAPPIRADRASWSRCTEPAR